MTKYKLTKEQRASIEKRMDARFWRLETKMLNRVLEQGTYNEAERKTLNVLRKITLGEI